jgi:hypothetical protein
MLNLWCWCFRHAWRICRCVTNAAQVAHLFRCVSICGATQMTSTVPTDDVAHFVAPDTQVVINATRMVACLNVFEEFVANVLVYTQEMVVLLHDSQWPEVARALAHALYRGHRRQGFLRPTLHKEFGKIYDYAVYSAFASTVPDVVATWFCQNTERLLRNALNSLLGISVKHKNAQTIRECFRMLIMIAGELGKYTASHKRLCNASAAHVALVVFDDMCPTSLLCTRTADLKQSHVYFMNALANAILQTPGREVTTWKDAFGHYSGHDNWRNFAARCIQVAANSDASAHIERLETIVRTTYATTAVLAYHSKNVANASSDNPDSDFVECLLDQASAFKEAMSATSAHLYNCASDDEEDRDVVTIFDTAPKAEQGFFKSGRAPKTTPPTIKRRNMTCTLKQQKRFKHLHNSPNGSNAFQPSSPPPRRLFERFGVFAAACAREAAQRELCKSAV